MRGKGWIVTVAMALAVLPTPARAVDLNAIWPDLGLPGFKITPFLSERIEYESNVFQTASNAQGSTVFKTIPGFTLELPLGRHRFDLGFRTEILRYVALGSQNTENYFVLARGALDFPGGLKITLKEDFAHTSDPPNTELTGPIESSTNIFGTSIEYALTRQYSIGLDYTFTHVSFAQDTGVEDLDRNEHLVALVGFYKIQPKTDLLASFAYGRTDFANDSDRNFNRYLFLVGVRGDITSRLSSTLRAGFESRQPDRSDLTKYNGLVASGDITYLATERTKLTLYSRAFDAGVDLPVEPLVPQQRRLALGRAFLHVQAPGHRRESTAGRTTIRTRGRRSTSRRTGGRTGSSAPPSGRSTRSRSGWP